MSPHGILERRAQARTTVPMPTPSSSAIARPLAPDTREGFYSRLADENSRAAVEDGLVASNPTSKVGKFAKTDKPAHQASAMTRKEAEDFLAAVMELCPKWYSFFLTALRAGFRKGEPIAPEVG